MRVQNILLLLSFLSFFYTSSGQEGALQLYQNGFYIRQYSEISGLVSNGCRNVFEDSRGLLWISSFMGLSRFDGKQFVNFGTNEGLPSPNVLGVYEDSVGYIYVSTPKGIARYTGYNKTDGSFFYVYPQTINGGLSPRGGFQPIDSNTILFQGARGTVYLLQNGKIKEIGAASRDGNCGQKIYHRNYRYYYAYVTDTMRVFDAQFKNVANIYHYDSGHSGDAADNSDNLHIYYKNMKRKVVGTEVVRTTPAPDSIVWFDCLDTLDKMVYYRNGGVYNYVDGKTTKILDLASLSLNCNSIYALRDGSIWIATNGGVFRIVPLVYKESVVTGSCFRYLDNHKVMRERGLLNDTLFAQGENKQLSETAYSILQDRNNITWFCTQQGIYKKEPGKHALLYTFPGLTQFWNENAGRITDAVEGPTGDIWFYGYCGVIHYQDGRFKHYKEENGLTGPGILIRYLTIDTDGTALLIDRYGRFLYVQGDTVLLLNKIDGVGNPVPGKIVSDGRGYLWIDYNKKLYKIRKQSPGNYTVVDSIIQNPFIARAEIKSFDFDRQGNCWMGYAGGKVQVFFAGPFGHYSYTNSVVYTMDDGTTPIAAANYSLYPDEKGNMIVVPSRRGGGRVFLFSAKDALARKDMSLPKLSLEEILINYKRTDWAKMGYISGPFGFPSSCKLSYTDNNIIFNYVGASLTNAGSVIFQIKLKGYDGDWQTTYNTMASYTNLPAGEYVFMVKAANPNGAWGKPLEYSFTILPPWYKTWWAILLWIIAGSSIVLFFFFLRINSIRMSNLRENNMFKSSLIGLIGHDMMTPLHYIAKVSSQLKTYSNKLSQKTTMDSLGDINITASRLRFFGESILHWISLQNTEFSPAMEKFRVNETIEGLVEFHRLLAVEKDNDVDYEIQNDLYYYQDPTLVKIIIHNLLLNANKFTTRGKIRITTTIENNWLIIKVADTGKGMDQDKVNSLNQFQPIMSSPGTLKEKGWGMGYKMIMDLLKFSRGTLHVKSKLNEGTEVTIKLPWGRKEYAHRLNVMHHN